MGVNPAADPWKGNITRADPDAKFPLDSTETGRKRSGFMNYHKFNQIMKHQSVKDQRIMVGKLMNRCLRHMLYVCSARDHEKIRQVQLRTTREVELTRCIVRRRMNN